MGFSTKPNVLTSEVTPLFFGQWGFRFLTSGSSPAGEVYAVIFANEDAVITATLNAPHGNSSVTSMPIPAGTCIYNIFTSVTVVSGSVTCYLTENKQSN